MSHVFESEIVLQCDRVNSNNRLYRKAAVEKAVANFQAKLPAVGTLGTTSDGLIRIADSSHMVTKLWMDDNLVRADIRILNTPSGQVLQKMLDEKTTIAFRTGGHCELEKLEGVDVITSFNLTNVFALPESEAA